MGVEVAVNRGTNGREKRILAKSGEKSEALELVFDGVFELREAQLGFCLVQCVV